MTTATTPSNSIMPVPPASPSRVSNPSQKVARSNAASRNYSHQHHASSKSQLLRFLSLAKSYLNKCDKPIHEPTANKPSTTTVLPLPGSSKSLHCNLTGPLPEHQIFDKKFQDLYQGSGYSERPAMQSVTEYLPELDTATGEYTSKFDRREWATTRPKFSKLSMLRYALSGMPFRTKARPIIDGVSTKVVTMKADDGSDIALRIQYPTDTNRMSTSTPAYIYAHGGGGVTGGAKPKDPSRGCTSGDHLTSRIVSALGIPTVSVDYRLAPENRWPAGQEDVTGACRWALENLAAEIGCPEISGVVVGGTSSGGGYALGASMEIAKDEGKNGESPLLGTVVTVPACDARDEQYESEEWKALSNPMMNPEISKWFAHTCARNPQDLEAMSVVAASDDNLKSLKDTTIIISPLDGLSTAALQVAERIRGLGGKVQVESCEGWPHMWQGLDAISSEARECNIKLIKAVGRCAGKTAEELEAITVDGLYPSPVWRGGEEKA